MTGEKNKTEILENYKLFLEEEFKIASE